MSVQLIPANREILIQSKFAELTSTASNNGTEIQLLAVTIIPKTPNSFFIVHFTVNPELLVGGRDICVFTLFAGFTLVPEEQEEAYAYASVSNVHEANGCYITQRVPTSGAGEQKFKVMWQGIGSRWAIRPTVHPDFEHASLLVLEVEA